MTHESSRTRRDEILDIGTVADVIVRSQYPWGEIPWQDGGKTDPWDHVEAAMGLTVAGRRDAARRAYDWLARVQQPDGSWFSVFRRGVPEDTTRQTNFGAYAAVGLYHYYLATGERAFLERHWDTLARAIDFAVGLQAPGGQIHWAVDPTGKVDPMALVTGCSSIYTSLKCALAVSRLLDAPRPSWLQALNRLGEALRRRPHLFNMTKARYAMDWFYPVLAGVFTGEAARRRIDRGWRKFVIHGKGVRCVSDRPWVTVAETCELVLALAAMGHAVQARMVFGWLTGRVYADGAYWCGFTVPDMTVWPEEKTTWTNAVVLMAADALYGLTPAGRIFEHAFWRQKGLGGDSGEGQR